MSTSNAIVGLKYLTAFFEDCTLYTDSFQDQLTVAAFFLGIFTYVAVLGIGIFFANWGARLAALGMFTTDMLIIVMSYTIPRVPQNNTECDPHTYDTPSAQSARCAFAAIYFMTFDAWTKQGSAGSTAWRLFLLLGSAAANAYAQIVLGVHNPREVTMGIVLGLLTGAAFVFILSTFVVHFKHSRCMKGFAYCLCVQNSRIVLSDPNDPYERGVLRHVERKAVPSAEEAARAFQYAERDSLIAADTIERRRGEIQSIAQRV